MRATLFAQNVNLRGSSRVPALAPADRISWAELYCLVACGALAAFAVGLSHLSIRIPGHAILWGALPMALGLAIVPRHWAGLIMAIAAGASATTMSLLQVGSFPSTAMFSVIAFGPVLDLALHRESKDWRLYLRFLVAGAAANMLAFALKWLGILCGMTTIGGSGQVTSLGWLAILSYFLCGAAAGLLSAAACFRIRTER